jgi:hypothetical protein
MKLGILGVTALSLMVAAPQSSAAILVYTTSLSGPAESPPNASLGTGFTEVDINTSAQTMEVKTTFSGLTSNTTASHIHCCVVAPGTAIVATTVPSFPGFPLGVTSGTFDNTFDLTLASTYNPAFVTASGGTVASAEAGLLAGLAAGTAYDNVHTTNFPNGEIRGFLHAVPEPSTWAMMLLGFCGLGYMAYRRRSHLSLAV